MPKPLPRLTPPPSDEPDTRDPLSLALATHLDDVRQWIEWATNGDPTNLGMIDYGIYRQFEDWIKKKEVLDLIDSILQRRLTSGYPHNHKAIILIQLIPRDRLSPYAKLLEPLLPAKPSEDPNKPVDLPRFYNPLIASLTASLHDLASVTAAEEETSKKNEEEKKKQDEEIQKWELWCNLYGKSNRADWRPHPGNPQWTYWGWQEIGQEDWWKGRND
ncbi:uncharacterized protein IL334_002203 [Kwoniella shivajii]|uniref:Uncharacterized protein n=1 Tax=Kwoniella shivajii TaxID=564305 RepID=A0ABZ1CU26_9TREE|nr:hypothetical protein IL334_002203 [Kwoniella shivajii]